MLKEVKQVFSALSEDKRLRMLKLIESGETYGAELATALNIAYSTACRHLGAMTDAGLVKTRQAGRRIFYSLSPRTTPSGALARMTCRWIEGDATVKDDLRKLRRARTKVSGR